MKNEEIIKLIRKEIKKAIQDREKLMLKETKKEMTGINMFVPDQHKHRFVNQPHAYGFGNCVECGAKP